MSIQLNESENVTRQLSVFKHIKKKAANDAQLLMNRIALIQKEEERARKKIEQTKDRAIEILQLREETEKRVQAYATATGEVKQFQQILIAKNREQEEENKRARQYRLESLQAKKKGEVVDMLMEKKFLTQMMIHEQEMEIKMKQKKRMEVKRMEDEMKRKKEQERIEKELKIKEYFEQKLSNEVEEAKKAERLVKALEKKEKEWIDKLRNAQVVQDKAYEELEYALHHDDKAIADSHYGTSPPASSSSNLTTEGNTVNSNNHYYESSELVDNNNINNRSSMKKVSSMMKSGENIIVNNSSTGSNSNKKKSGISKKV